MRWSLSLSAGVAVAALVGTACGGGSSGDGTSFRGPVDSRPATAAAPAASACPASAGLDASVKSHGAAPAPGLAIALEAGDSFFAPTCVTSVPGGTATVTVKNSGSALHNISFPDQGIDVDVEAGKSITVQVKIATTTLAFFCKYHRTSGMAGALLPAQG